MKIAFVVDRPTQLEAPFFRYASRGGESELHVIFTGHPSESSGSVDPELGFMPDWGIDLFGGYRNYRIPETGGRIWLSDMIGRGGYDLVVINGYASKWNAAAAFVAKRAGARVGLRLDSVEWNLRGWRGSVKSVALPFAFRFVDCFFPVGTLAARYLERFGVPRDRIFLFSYPVDNEWFEKNSQDARSDRPALRSRFGIPEGKRVILSVAKFSQREAPFDLIEAAGGLDEDLALLLVGDGPLRANVRDLCVSLPRLTTCLPGYLPFHDLPMAYGAADLFVHTSHDEPWGVSVQEALACGVPVVASDRVGSSHDLVFSGVNGVTYAHGDIEALRSALTQALEIPRSESALDPSLEWSYERWWQNLMIAARSK